MCVEPGQIKEVCGDIVYIGRVSTGGQRSVVTSGLLILVTKRCQ